MQFQPTENFALESDQKDTLSHFRKLFHIPVIEGKEVIYLCGNSLGLQSKSVRDHINTELKAWEEFGVEGHFKGENPWADYHWKFKSSYSSLLGAKPEEVVVMNSLTSNLHMLMVSFYRPTAGRFKILMESGAFPSDQYAIESQVRFHGFDPDEAIIELIPRDGEDVLRTGDIIKSIETNSVDLALVMLPGVQYYTGQFFDIEEISKVAKEKDIRIGWDLAHTVGNLPLSLHDWGMDFAVWCSYKYLNSGPGGIGGIFVHQRHAKDQKLPRFAGWWGHQEEERFLMKKGFKPMEGADGWQLSNKNILSLAAQKASLEIFEEAGIVNLREKSIQLTSYLEYLIYHELSDIIHILTPKDPTQRGCQLSLVVQDGKNIFRKLTENGVIADWREPNVIRVAPVPLYNTFHEVYSFVQIIKKTVIESTKA